MGSGHAVDIVMSIARHRTASTGLCSLWHLEHVDAMRLNWPVTNGHREIALVLEFGQAGLHSVCSAASHLHVLANLAQESDGGHGLLDPHVGEHVLDKVFPLSAA